MHWLVYAFITTLCWGLYGGLLAKGVMGFDDNRMKAFLFVGVAYFLVAIIGPMAVLAAEGEAFNFMERPKGIQWSLIAGVAGAMGAFTLLFALSNNPIKPPTVGGAQVMSVVFAGAPIVSAIFAIAMKGGLKTAPDWRFIAGLVCAAVGGTLVTLYKP
jgi:drug/metabolite transporter (DMT)-like permease